VVSASLEKNGLRAMLGRLKVSLSNYRLKLAARGRPVADGWLRTRAAA
jgi:hypothetical protein